MTPKEKALAHLEQWASAHYPERDYEVDDYSAGPGDEFVVIHISFPEDEMAEADALLSSQYAEFSRPFVEFAARYGWAEPDTEICSGDGFVSFSLRC